ncbi:cyclase family protein [Streptomyces cellostaticus]|uniref:cyclase family protein n=1 Tax=Streptomyces cellostaticus TaxID=67285 RepID=UPI0020272E92|nr:cyclase family protein [Streptomyces cellostaticus]
MRIIDLSSPIDADGWEPDPVRHDIMTPAEGARHMSEEMKRHFGLDLDPSELPGGELLSLDTLTLTSHTGTHVDAPSHYGSTASYGVPRHIDRMPLEWFLRPGMLLDVSDVGTGVIDRDQIQDAIKRVGRQPEPLDIVLLRTGAAQHAGTPRYFTDFAGLDGPATEYLLDFGVRVIGTDAWSLDAPFPDMIRRYRESGDPSVLWPAHFAGRRTEYCQIERLAHLEDLPASTGFQVCCFPVKIRNGGAGWARAVALVDG